MVLEGNWKPRKCYSAEYVLRLLREIELSLAVGLDIAPGAEMVHLTPSSPFSRQYLGFRQYNHARPYQALVMRLPFPKP